MPGSGLRHHAFYNLVGSIVPIGVTIFTIPLYINAIGETRYGLINLIWLAFGYFGVFDLGLSRAAAYRISVLARDDRAGRASVFYTACALNLALGLTSGLVFYALTTPLAEHFTQDPIMRAETLAALPLVAAFFPIGLLGGVLAGCLQSNEQFLDLNLQQSVGSILFQSLPLVAVFTFGTSLHSAVLGAVTARLISIGWLGFVCFRWASGAGRPALRRAHVRKLFSYGGWITLSDLIAPLLNGLDQMVIGTTLGAKFTAYYSVPFSMASKALIIPASLTRAVFPRLSNLSGREAAEISMRSLAVLASIMALVCVPAMLLSRPIISLWIGPDFADHSHLAASFIAAGVWFNSLGYIPYTLLQARGRPDLVAKIHAYEIIPFVLVLLVLISAFGVAGAAAAWCLRVVADAVLQARFAGLPPEAFRPALVPGVVLLGALGVCLLDPGTALALASTAVAVSVLAVWIFATDDLMRYARPGFWSR